MPSYTKSTTKIILIILGVVTFCIGVVGIALPILPTTPFLLLASFLFCKSSKKLHDWLESNRVFGEYIRNYRQYRAIKRITKIISIALLWITLGISIYFVDVLYLRILLCAVGIGVTVHLIRIKTLERVLAQKEKSCKEAQQNKDISSVNEYFNKLADSWDDSAKADPDKLTRIADLCDIMTEQRVLDIACGTGVMFPFLLARNPKVLLGVDICEAMIRKARSKLPDSRLKIIEQDFLALDEVEFDCAICYNAYPHFLDKAAFAKKLRDVLVSGGRFVVAHGSGRDDINTVHKERAACVSVELCSAEEEKEWFEPYFNVDMVIDNVDIYVISGTKI